MNVNIKDNRPVHNIIIYTTLYNILKKIFLFMYNIGRNTLVDII